MSRIVSEIVVHCAATRPEWMADCTLAEQVEEIRRWHVRGRGWADIGYHWIVGRDGSVRAGRPEGRAGAHVLGRNEATIGVCLVGGFGSSADDPPEAHFTGPQLDALFAVIEGIRARHPQVARVSGHNEHAARACPGFDVPAWLASRWVAAEIQLVEVAPPPPPPPPPPAPPGRRGLLAALGRLFRLRS